MVLDVSVHLTAVKRKKAVDVPLEELFQSHGTRTVGFRVLHWKARKNFKCMHLMNVEVKYPL